MAAGPRAGARSYGRGEKGEAVTNREELPLFTRTFDFLKWLLPAANEFPRAHRHSFTKRLLDAAFDLRECLEEANVRRGAERRERLDRADEALARVRVYVRLAAQFGWLSAGQPASPVR